MVRRSTRCRICGNEELVAILDLGQQALTGIFPKRRDQAVAAGPLKLVKCAGRDTAVCGLVQLAHSYDPSEMYGADYGYRSGINASMVRHLADKVARICTTAPLHPGDLVIDIGSNDGTTLAAYPANRYDLLGVDPTGAKFRDFYPPHVQLIAEFFARETVRARLGARRARVVTSFSMFYDLERPGEFVREVLDILEDDGIWVLEQSYLPTMLETNGYDTVCHEHLEYYSLAQIKWMADRAGAKIVDVEFNNVNGGSFSVTIARAGAPQPEMAELPALLAQERSAGLDGLAPYQAFAERVARSRQNLREFFDRARHGGSTVAGLGASTKGNVLLQYCNATEADISCIGEVNPDKFGAFTPGTLIPIVPEVELLARKPDYLLVLPWHYRPFFEASSQFRGQRLVFPLPELAIKGS
jgi:NDP-4-keto-2,6-dideoxyhexose 3-C-methyltransferase